MTDGLLFKNSGHVEEAPKAAPSSLASSTPVDGLVYANTSAPTKPAVALPDPADEAAAAMFPGNPDPKGAPDAAIPEAIRALRAADSDRTLFSVQKKFAHVVKPEHLADGEGITPEMKVAAAAEVREIFEDLGMSVPEASRFMTILRQTVEAQPTEEVRATWRDDATKLIISKYGKDGAQQALDCARSLVARDPRFAQMIAETGTGDHPDMVMALIETAKAERARGRL